MRQHSRFVGQLEIILTRMKDGHSVTPLLRDLGKMHRKFGVGNDDFRNFGISLIKVMQEFLGSEFDGSLRSAWTSVYEEIARTMMSADDRAGRDS